MTLNRASGGHLPLTLGDVVEHENKIGRLTRGRLRWKRRDKRTYPKGIAKMEKKSKEQ